MYASNKADGTKRDCYPKKKQKVLSPLELDAKAAREAGMTYGKYKALQYAEKRGDYYWARVK